LLRGFYAFEDTRPPLFRAVWIGAVDIALATACHLLLPARWAVTGMAGAYTLSYVAGLTL
jgi:putative peptidoglycan lipid II flippase